MPPGIDDLIKDAQVNDEFLMDLQKNHRIRVRSAIKKAEKRTVALMKKLETNKSGRVEGLKVNLKQAQANQVDMAKIFQAEYGVVIEELVEEFDKISAQIARSYKGLGESVNFTGIDKDMIDTLKAQSLGEYEVFGVQAQQRLSTGMYNSVIAGSEFSSLVDTVTGIFTGHVDIRGVPMTVHAQTHAFDSVMNFHNQVNLKKAEDLGMDEYLYVGDIIKTSRKFCKTRAGRTYTKEQIESWDKLDWAGKRGPAWEFRGGWNCRHHWRPIKSEWMEDEDEIEVQDFGLERSEGT